MTAASTIRRSARPLTRGLLFGALALWFLPLLLAQASLFAAPRPAPIPARLPVPPPSKELQPETLAAFDRYVAAAEARMAAELRNGIFLHMDAQPEAQRRESYEQLRAGKILVEHMRAEQDDAPIHIPHGLVHHWIGVVFIPGVKIAQVLGFMQAYNQHAKFFAPMIQRSELLSHEGPRYESFRRMYRKQVVTVVIDARFADVYTLLDATQVTVRSRSIRIAEIADPGKPAEHELPVGNDHGYIWRFYNDWRIEEKDGGVYAQVESVALSRTVPAAFAWLVNPIVKRVPRDVLTTTLAATRDGIRAWQD